MEYRCTSEETIVTTRSITAVMLSMRIPAFSVMELPTTSQGNVMW